MLDVGGVRVEDRVFVKPLSLYLNKEEKSNIFKELSVGGRKGSLLSQYCHLYYLSLCGLNKIFWKRRLGAFECVEYKELDDLDPCLTHCMPFILLIT